MLFTKKQTLTLYANAAKVSCLLVHSKQITRYWIM